MQLNRICQESKMICYNRKMFQKFGVFLSFFIFFFFFPRLSLAQTIPAQEIDKAQAIQIISEGETIVPNGDTLPYQIVKIKILDGKDAGKEIWPQAQPNRDSGSFAHRWCARGRW